MTGGGSGIGRRLEEGLQRLGNTVIIAGRRRQALEEVIVANPGMAWATLDIEDPKQIARFAETIVRDHSELNVLLNNAGVMRPEDLTADEIDLSIAEAAITTNLLGPARLTAALLPHLRSRPASAVMNVTSGLAFVPIAATPTYSATKAELHSFSQSLREQLKGSLTEVIEIIPPYVQTTLLGERQATEARAIPLDAYLSETLGKTMIEQAQSILPRDAKGPIASPPSLRGDLQTVAEAVVTWPDVIATTHWHFADQSRIDGVDSYVRENELGQINLDGSIATTPALAAELISEGLGSRFPYARGWTQASVARLSAA